MNKYAMSHIVIEHLNPQQLKPQLLWPVFLCTLTPFKAFLLVLEA